MPKSFLIKKHTTTATKELKCLSGGKRKRVNARKREGDVETRSTVNKTDDIEQHSVKDCDKTRPTSHDSNNNDHCTILNISAKTVVRHLKEKEEPSRFLRSKSRRDATSDNTRHRGIDEHLGITRRQDDRKDPQSYTCSICGKGYATSSNLSRHKQTHRSLDSKQAKACKHCGKRYVSMPALSMHLLTHKRLHECAICGKRFSRPWLLQGHIRSHTGERPFQCNECDKSFADRSNLRAHEQTHSVLKQHHCMRCNRSFALKSYLTKHIEATCFAEDKS